MICNSSVYCEWFNHIDLGCRGFVSFLSGKKGKDRMCVLYVLSIPSYLHLCADVSVSDLFEWCASTLMQTPSGHIF